MSDLLGQVVSLFQKEWPVISAAPLAYIVAALVGGIIVSFLYRHRIITYQERIEHYKERLGQDLRGNIYARSTNDELKRAIFKLTIEMEAFGDERGIAIQRVIYQELGEGSEEERRKRWLHRSEELARITGEFNGRFLGEFSGKATNLLREARTRVPPDQSKVDESSTVDSLLQFGLTGPHPTGAIIAELKRLAHLLPLLDTKRWFLYWQDGLFTILLFLLLTLVILHWSAMCFTDR